MNTSDAPSLGARLRRARELAGYSQQEAADVVGTAREVVSYWENGRRVPSLTQVERLGALYGTSAGSLLNVQLAAAEDHEVLFRGLSSQPAHTKAGVGGWLGFLDAWAELLARGGWPLPGRGVPSRPDWRGHEPITDSRRAAKLAADVCEHYRIGTDAIPDLLAFLDRHGVLVCRVPLDRVGQGEGVSGVFYNHPRLGFCVLVNTRTTPGRQAFTLAHEWAHALFHYHERGLVSRAADPDRKERFADEFAAHLLVPREQLVALVRRGPLGRVDNPLEVIHLHRYFRVSYATMLIRLRSCGLITPERYEEFRRYSPSALASTLGLEGEDYRPSADAFGVTLGSYPTSVLEQVRAMVTGDDLTPAGAADLLRVSQEEILQELLASPEAADPEELREFTELPAPTTPRRTKGTGER